MGMAGALRDSTDEMRRSDTRGCDGPHDAPTTARSTRGDPLHRVVGFPHHPGRPVADRLAVRQHRGVGRSLHLSGLLDGMGQLDGLLDPEGLALVREAIRLFSPIAEGDTRTPAQRRADGLVNIARTALSNAEHRPGKKRRRPEVIATISLTDLMAGANGGRLDTDIDSSTITSAQVRQSCCDATIHRYVADPAGTVVDDGQGRRTVSDAQFDQLVIRDHGCRWPGCGVPSGGCDAHHADHWLDHDATKNDNLILWCWHHHRLLHRQHWSIEPHRGGHFTLTTPAGHERDLRPPLVGLTLPCDQPS